MICIVLELAHNRYRLQYLEKKPYTEQVSEKETIEKITEMLFSGKKWVTNKGEEQE